MKHLGLLVMLIGSIVMASVAPQFRGDLLGGGTASLKNLLNPKRGLLVCFWASWCAPCLEELKKITEGLKTDPTLALDVVTVNVDTSETSSDVKPTVKLYGFNFPVLLDPKHEIFAKYQQSKLLPFSALIGPTGEIAKAFSGLHDDMMAELKTVLVETLKDPHATAKVVTN